MSLTGCVVTATHVVCEVDDGHVLVGPADGFTDFAETGEVLLDDLPLVEARGDVPAHDGGEVTGGHAAETVQALTASPAGGGGQSFSRRARRGRRVYRGVRRSKYQFIR